MPADQLETYLALTLIAFALLFPATGYGVFTAVRRILLPFVRRPKLTIAIVGILPIVLRVALLVRDPMPPPRSMEEHNHLLQADTYAHWRLANPPHPLSILFYSYQIVVWPHYVSSRPALSALFFFLGELLFHSPFLGNLISVGLLSSCIYWMLLGWTPRRWATLGSFLVLCEFCFFGYWVNSYWGPTVPILGGVLLLGLVPRICRRPKFIYALWFSVGVALLVGSRPYEGAFYIAAIITFLLARILGGSRRAELNGYLKKFVFPVVAGCCLVVVAQVHYNVATTGNVKRMPYQIWREAQTAVPAFFWQPISTKPQSFAYPGQVQFRNWEILRAQPLHRNIFWTTYILVARHGISIRDIIGSLLLLPILCWSGTWFSRSVGRREKALLGAVVLVLACCMINVEVHSWWSWPLNLAVFVALLFRWNDRQYRLPLLLVLGGTLITSFSSFYMNNYFTPFVGAVIVLIVTGLRNLAQWDTEGKTGASLAGFLTLGVIIMLVVQFSAAIIGHPLYAYSEMGRFDLEPFTLGSRLAAQLSSIPGKHLVLEPIAEDNVMDSNHDLVWNLADIDHQRIVWARDLVPDWTAAAVAYYKDRTVWIVTGSGKAAHLERYPLERLPHPAQLSTLPMPDKQVSQ